MYLNEFVCFIAAGNLNDLQLITSININFKETSTMFRKYIFRYAHSYIFLRLITVSVSTDAYQKQEIRNNIYTTFEPDVLRRHIKKKTYMGRPPFILDLSSPTTETMKIARDELRETPENVARGLKELQELLENDKTIKYDTDEEFLMCFLRPCKFYARSAYELMRRIADFRAKYKDSLYGILPEQEKGAMCSSVVNVLKERDHKGRRVLIIGVGSTWNPSEIHIDRLFRILYLLHLAAMFEPETQIRGIVVVMDYKGAEMKQISAFTPFFAMKLISFLQDALPMRLKEIHIVNNPYLFNIIWYMIKPLLRSKLRNRIHIHGSNMKFFHSFIPGSHLPKDYGGDRPLINYNGRDWYPVLEDHIGYIKRWNSSGKI
ncbi:CRAL/TRIO domain [Popillia japonica]|uniref:CRAL/TRIO domain n=1 Tax=Popillia japonica TaxID=7064 RepID=A0AAW1ICU9_POPJA